MRRRTTRRKVCRARAVVALLFFGILAAAITGAVVHTIHAAFAPADGKTVVTDSREAFEKRINVLLLGLSDGDQQLKAASKRSDAIIVASINPEDGNIDLISIPRDTRVTIPGQQGYDKINQAFARGGPELSVRTVEDFLRIPINYYIVIDWQGFIKVVDILGGVDLYVENDMNYEDPYAKLSIHLAKGYQHLSGLQAGEYVRFRHDEMADIGRIQRQQRFLKILGNQMRQPGTILKLPALAETFKQYVSTDMSLINMVKLANTFKGARVSDLHADMVPGNSAVIDNSSYWVPDKEQVCAMVERIFIDKTPTSGSVHEHSSNHDKGVTP